MTLIEFFCFMLWAFIALGMYLAAKPKGLLEWLFMLLWPLVLVYDTLRTLHYKTKARK